MNKSTTVSKNVPGMTQVSPEPQNDFEVHVRLPTNTVALEGLFMLAFAVIAGRFSMRRSPPRR
jgi:hypothetical protein